jgi:hypothetical protein
VQRPKQQAAARSAGIMLTFVTELSVSPQKRLADFSISVI